MKGLLTFVYKHGTDSTNNGLSSQKDKLILVGENIGAPFKVNEGDDYLVLETDGKGNFRAVPNSLINSKMWVMFGGNFIYSSDSRFPSKTPIKVFDRVEKYFTTK